LEVEGQTREFNDPPLDYEALGFERDPDVMREENNMEKDDITGTRTYEDFGKTVFANWIYVSPMETVTIKYKYLLPFKVLFHSEKTAATSYSLLFQKQSGSLESELTSQITFPENYIPVWKYPDSATLGNNTLNYKANLKTDKFLGATFTKDQNIILNF